MEEERKPVEERRRRKQTEVIMPEGTGEMELRVDGAVEYRRHALGMILFGAVLVIGILAFPAFLNSRYGVMMFVAGIGFIGWGGIRLLEVHGDEGGSTE